MSIRLEFNIKFKSDYHVGAGHGLGLQVDSALLRDADNVPVIRGTVLTGLLRESLMNLLNLRPLAAYRQCEASGLKTEHEHAFCGQFASGEADCPVCAIFGSPRHMKRWQISSARPVELMVPQVHSRDWRAGETASQTTTRVRVNPRTRRAEENKLFTREEGDGSLHFHFVVECPGDDETAWREAEWLLAAARMLRNLGAGKRRGYGECEIHLMDRGQETKLLDRFGSRLEGKAVERIAQATKSAVASLALLPDPGQHAYRLQVLLRTDEPLLIARRAEAGNQFESLESIPGSVLRGALAWRLAQRAGNQLDDHSSDDYQNFAALFFLDTVRFSTLTPVEVKKSGSARYQGHATIAAPRDLATCELHPGYAGSRGDNGHGVWSQVRDDDSFDECPICGRPDDATDRKAAKVKLESVNGFVSLIEGGRTKFKPKQTSEMHIRIEPKSGRVHTGDLYGYVSLEPGQYFVGEITCTNESVWQALQQMAELQPVGQVNELRLGKAGQRGYGKASIVFQPATESPWHGLSSKDRIKEAEHVTLLLLSDAIVTDPWGRFWRGFDTDWLKRELKLPDSAAVAIDKNAAHEERAFSAVRSVDAFNAKLGLPRSRDVAIVAGSSVRLTFSGIELSDLLKKLETAEAQGIGLRRDEGFGRVAFNHPVYEGLANWKCSALGLSQVALEDASQSHPSTALIQFALDWMKELDEKFNEKRTSDSFKDERFEAVARLLHVSRRISSSAIKQDLQRLGKMEELLPEALKGRDKKNFFESDGKNGMDETNVMLDEMASMLRQRSLDHDSHAWRIGLQMLAARIAELAHLKAQERR